VLLSYPSQAPAPELTSSDAVSTSVNVTQSGPKTELYAVIVDGSNAWLKAYAKRPPNIQLLLKSAAVSIAKLRRAALKILIEHDPERALLLSLAPGERQGLPKFVLDLMETRVHATGDLILAITETLPEAPKDTPGDANDPPSTTQPMSITSWTARIGETTHRAFVYGLRLEHQTKFDTPIHGISLDDLMAVSHRLLYRFDPFETVQLGFKPEQIVATSGDLPFLLPDIDAFVDLEQELVDDVLRFGPIPFPFHPNEWTTGIKNLLVLKIRYGIDPQETPYSDGDIAAWVGGANTFFQENSQGLTSFTLHVISAPFAVLSAETYRGASSVGVAHDILLDHARNNARALGYDIDAYDRIIFLAPQLFDGPMANARIGGREVIVTGATPDLRVTLAHELGHTYGFSHSAALEVFGPDPLGPSISNEYGDMWDIMGVADLDETRTNPARRHFNAFFKTLAGWLPLSAVIDGTLGGDVRLYAHDAEDPVGTRAIFIETRDGNSYWLEKRGQFPWNTSMFNGIEVRRVVNAPPLPGYGPIELLDLDNGWTPGTPPDRRVFHSLAQHATFTDAANGVTIRVIIVTEDTLGRYARVFITR
jgi:hypothetical protein